MPYRNIDNRNRDVRARFLRDRNISRTTPATRINAKRESIVRARDKAASIIEYIGYLLLSNYIREFSALLNSNHRITITYKPLPYRDDIDALSKSCEPNSILLCLY